MARCRTHRLAPAALAVDGPHMSAACPVSIVIPTLGREAVLLDTLGHLLALADGAAEILVIDQTPEHEPATQAALTEMDRSGRIRWLRQSAPSITAAMNRGLLEARQDIVLYLDDDIVPGSGLVRAHLAAHESSGAHLVAGRVIQPWQSDTPDDAGDAFSFNSGRPAWISEFMGGNFSVARDIAIDLGGFDENFVRVAYRFEAEFAHRYRAAAHRIAFEPQAVLRHLKAPSGGTRSFGDHLTTWRPDHAVGAYYHGLRTGKLRELVARPSRAVVTRYHLRHPWRVPGTLLAEAAALGWALWLFARGPKRLNRRK
jgi:glycosyltransferase involved in cell wall biosynthesis